MAIEIEINMLLENGDFERSWRRHNYTGFKELYTVYKFNI